MDRYMKEREIRLRPDGNEQYEDVGKHPGYLADPFAEPFERDAVKEDVDVLIVGGGFASQLTAVRLQQAGISLDRVRIVEKAGDFGGTWYWNRYPGAQFTHFPASSLTESYIYLPLLEESGYIPSEKYARAPEILEYCQLMGRKFGLYDRALFQTEVTGARWDDAASRWIVSTGRGDEIRARFICLCSGPLHRMKLPGVEGIDSFKGKAFHTSRFDYNYTGKNLENLKDKRVGIVGTGCTAVQAIPYLAEASKHLYVFQRTPSAIDMRGNVATQPEFVESLKPGWQRERMVAFNNIACGLPSKDDPVYDGWTRFFLHLNGAAATAPDPASAGERVMLANHIHMEMLRKVVEDTVKDKETAEALKAQYIAFCKRPVFNDEYLPTFNRPNVTLVDTKGKGIERVTEKGIVAAGQEYELDVIVWASGFEVGTSYARRCGFETVGRDGVTLTEKWKDGVISLHGMTTAGFPNCFVYQMPQAGVTGNQPHMLDEMAKAFTYVVTETLNRGCKSFETTPEAEEEWLGECMKLAYLAKGMYENCTPGYYNAEGKLTNESFVLGRNGPYGGFSASPAYFAILDDWKSEGSLKGMKLTPA
ncbi:cyclohexanone monooxygenase [Hyaloraphidium curvatum]|nr:cyclohexanone monooxygenase [Hyaloraphidium curvatum]